MMLFRQYLIDIFAENYTGLDDEMPEAEDEWFAELDPEDVIEYAEKWGEKLKAEVERLKDADVTAGVIRMENKKIGGTLSAICKLLKEDGSEKRYHDQADIDSLLGDKQP